MKNIPLVVFISLCVVCVVLATSYIYRTAKKDFSKEIVLGTILPNSTIMYVQEYQLSSGDSDIVPVVLIDTNEDGKNDLSVRLNLTLPGDQGVLVRKYYDPARPYHVEVWLSKEETYTSLRIARRDLD